MEIHPPNLGGESSKSACFAVFSGAPSLNLGGEIFTGVRVFRGRVLRRGPAMGFTVKRVLRRVLRRGFCEGGCQKVPRTSPRRDDPYKSKGYQSFSKWLGNSGALSNRKRENPAPSKVPSVNIPLAQRMNLSGRPSGSAMECWKKTNKQKTHKHFSDGPCGTIVPGTNLHPSQGQTGQNRAFTVWN